MAEIDRLPVLEYLYSDRPTPRWTPAVKREVVKGTKVPRSRDFCHRILNLTWLEDPIEPKDTSAVLYLRSQLSKSDQSQSANMGEAESIILAREVSGSFMTNDFGAYGYAGRTEYLGTSRVLTACDALHEAYNYNQMSLSDVEQAHDQIRLERNMICECQFKSS